MALAALASLVLSAWGPLPELLSQSNPWYGFHSEDAALLSVRAQTVDFRATGTACQGWMRALRQDAFGVPFEGGAGLAIWKPWTEQQLSGIESCEAEPCDVKLSPAEVAEMKKAKPDSRLKTFLNLASGRSERYLKTQERKEYEFPGNPIEPWSFFVKKGLKAEGGLPSLGELKVRKLDFSKGKAKVLHQVLDRRELFSPNGDSGQLWVRDVYTDHYFDSWGEWTWIHCDEQGAAVVQALFFELDLLKKEDLISKLMRGKMRGESEEQGRAFLDQSFARLKKDAARNPTPRPSEARDASGKAGGS